MGQPAVEPDRPLILAVDDEPFLLQMVSRVLRSAGFAVLEAPDGLAAKDLLAHNGVEPELVLTDIRMPHLDGVQLGREVARLRPHLPVAYMSGHGVDPTEFLSPDQLTNCYLAKPFAPAALIALVRKCIAYSRR
jgi:DNA-binding response OmpR family regulator